MRTAFTKLALRRMARKNPQYRDQIRQILRDGDLIDAFTAAATEQSIAEGLVGESPVMEWFQWLVEWMIANPELMMQIITMLLTLFAGEDDT